MPLMTRSLTACRSRGRTVGVVSTAVGLVLTQWGHPALFGLVPTRILDRATRMTPEAVQSGHAGVILPCLAPFEPVHAAHQPT
jgi:hypothetical protein